MDDDELAFYDAVAQNQSAVEGQGEDVLAQIARELVTVLRRDIRTDSTVRDDVRAELRSSIKRLPSSTATHPTSSPRFKPRPDSDPCRFRLLIGAAPASI